MSRWPNRHGLSGQVLGETARGGVGHSRASGSVGKMETVRRMVHRAALALGACALLTSASTCSFETRSDEYACTLEGGCSDGRVCIDGWCVNPNAHYDSGLEDGTTPDSAPAVDGAPTVDAPANPDASQPDAGIDCPNGDCGPLEDPTVCPDDCSTCDVCTAGTCEDTCGGAGNSCSFTCPAGTCTCGFDCQSADSCEARCEEGTSCDIDCTGANDCHKVRCLGGAQCRLHCTGATSCEFSQCTGGSGVVSCADGAACNRDC